jgi:hypothetical protein
MKTTVGIDSYSGPADKKRAKDEGYLECFYTQPVDNYIKALVRPEDFTTKQSRKRPDGTRKAPTQIIKRYGRCYYNVADEYWVFQTVDEVNGETVIGDEYKVHLENIDFL